MYSRYMNKGSYSSLLGLHGVALVAPAVRRGGRLDFSGCEGVVDGVVDGAP